MDDIAGVQVLGGAVEWEGLETGEPRVDADDAVAAVVAGADGDALWV